MPMKGHTYQRSKAEEEKGVDMPTWTVEETLENRGSGQA